MIAVRAPGRVNVIGEHTDYNDGRCLPFAIAAGLVVRAAPSTGFAVRAAALGERDRFPAEGIERAPGWRGYVRGMVASLLADDLPLAGATLEIEGDLPRGAGLSSSSALLVGVGLALGRLAGAPDPDPWELAARCAEVERSWAGVPSGRLDPLACQLGTAGHAVLLDLGEDHAESVPIALPEGWRFVVAASGAERTLAQSGYAQRRAECEAAARRLSVASLRAVGDASALDLPAPLDARVRHVVSENVRVFDAAVALRGGDGPWLGALLDASHRSLRDDYASSHPAVDATRDRLLAAGAAGARIMGGGFGGSVLGLLGPDCPTPASAVEMSAGAGAG